jgi:hypothetical protein
MFQAYRPILRRVHTSVHTTIGSYSVCTVQVAYGTLCEQLCELS